MKKEILSGLFMAALFVFTSCEYRGNDMDLLVDDDSDRPGWAGGNKELNDHRKQNDETGIPKGDDYGDLYVLKRLESGAPEMGVTSIGVWYPKAIAFDADGDPVPGTDGYATLSVNDEGEIDDKEYAPHEVEFGRMNLVRSPESVLTAGLNEAISNLTAGSYITTDFCGRLVAVHGNGLDWDPKIDEEDDKTIDSPRENMAIYRELMRFGLSNQLMFLKEAQNGFTDDDVLTLAASALAAGSDKTGQITLDEVVYINGFMKAYGSEDYIQLNSIPYLNEFSNEYEYCDDPYYSELKFYDYSYSYDRDWQYGNKWVKITVLNPDNSYSVEIAKLVDKVPFTNMRIDNDHEANLNLAGFTQACDDAVQVLEFIHESSLVEYLGESEIMPTLQ